MKISRSLIILIVFTALNFTLFLSEVSAQEFAQTTNINISHADPNFVPILVITTILTVVTNVAQIIRKLKLGLFN